MAAVAKAHKFGVIGDKRRRLAGDTKKPTPLKTKNTFMIHGEEFGNIRFELDEKYVPIKVLGDGSYGVVCSCLNRWTNERVAIKKIGNAFDHESVALRTLREIQLLRQISHENVISLENVTVSSSLAGKSDFKDVYLVQELMDFDLAHVLRNYQISASNCKWLLFQILTGLEFLHSVNVIHRDLKPQNLLIREKGLQLKICDFGLARTKSNGAQAMTEYVVTRWFRPPELLLCSELYGNEIDLWSVGCIFAMMLGGGKMLFNGAADSLSQMREIHRVLGTQNVSDLGFIHGDRLRKWMKDLPFSSGVSFRKMYPHADPLAIDLLSRMLVMNPLRRISAKKALEHPYFRGMYHPVCSAPTTSLKLEVDENPDLVDVKMVRDLIWEEMLLFHPEERKNKC